MAATPDTLAVRDRNTSRLGELCKRCPVHTERRASDHKSPLTSVCKLPSFLLSPSFNGWDHELYEIEERLSNAPGKQPRCCIVQGMPGVGKTQLALKFATLAFRHGRYLYVPWVWAMSVGKVVQDFSKLADLVRLPGRYGLEQTGRLPAMWACLEGSTAARSWLLI